MKKAIIVGIHPIADEPVHLIEIEINASLDEFDFGKLTQENASLPQSDWQVAYDEVILNQNVEQTGAVFFFHYLNFRIPFQSSFGPLYLIPATPLPERLAAIKYKSP